MKRLVLGLLLLVFLCAAAQAQIKMVDGWYVEYRGYAYVGSNTKFSYRVSPGMVFNDTGVLRSVGLGVPTCFPDILILDASSTATTVKPSLTQRRDNSNGVVGIVWEGLNKAPTANTYYDFSYTVKGRITEFAEINVGLTDDDKCGGCCLTCGMAGRLPGPKCTLDGMGVCGLISHSDIVLMHDQSGCVNRAAADAQRAASEQFVKKINLLREKARIAIGSYHWGNTSSCQTTRWPSNMTKPYLKDYARYSSVLNDAQTAWDYDGYLTQNYGTTSPITNTHRALAAFASESPYTCGSAPLDAGLEIGGLHLISGWADPQTPNYLVIVSNGRPNKFVNGTCANACDCAEARKQALLASDTVKASGTQILTVYLDDGGCGCSATQVQAGKDFLKGQIASSGSNYYEATAGTLQNVYRQIYDKVTQFVACDPNQFKPYEACCNETTGACYPCPTPTAIVKQCPPFDCKEISTSSLKSGLKNKARAFYNLNHQTILRLRSKSQQQKWVKENKAIYQSVLKTIKLMPTSSTQCTLNECCIDEKINVKTKNDMLSLIDKQYRLYKSIRKIIPGWGSPGVPCTRSKAECERDKKKYQDLLKWLDKRAKQIRANELIQTKEIPLVDAECRNIYAV